MKNAFTMQLDTEIIEEATFFWPSIIDAINRVSTERELWLQEKIGKYKRLPKFITKRIFNIEIHKRTLWWEVYILRRFWKVVAQKTFKN